MVEIDIPCDNSAVESYGRSFTSWTEDNFKKLTKTLVNTLVATPFAFVVFLVTFFLISVIVLGVPFSGAITICLQVDQGIGFHKNPRLLPI